MAKFCKNCGQELEDDAIFCMECGTKADAKSSINRENIN